MSREWFPPSRPLDVEGGIRAQSRTGAFADGWWAQRWIQVVESSNIGARLGRGKNYARRGQVMDLHLDSGSVTASVQGSRAEPYYVTISLDTLSDSQREILAGAISSIALYRAQLLAGHLPEDTEELFAACGISLFPAHIATSCSCPDWSNPCKHIAAVFYLVGEELDRDPLLLFRLRGIEPQDVLTDTDESDDSSPTQPLPTDQAAFWEGGAFPDIRTSPPHVTDEPELLRALGKFPLWRGRVSPLEALTPAYQRAAQRAKDTLERHLDGTNRSDA